MWKGKEDERQPTRAQQPVPVQRPETQRQESPSPAPMPVRPMEARPAEIRPGTTSGQAAVIGATVSIRGDVISREDLFVNGSIEGSLEASDHRVSVGPRGKVRASISAREVVIQGAVEGNIEAREKLIIKNEGSLVGDIHVAGIVIEDGAYFKGSIDIIRARNDSKAVGE